MTAGTARPEALVRVRENGPVAELTVGDGTKRNALTSRAWDNLAQQVRVCGEDGSAGVIVIRGRGDTFCAGSDIGEWLDAEPEFVEESFARMETAFQAIEQCPVPVVAAIHGVAAGAGCQLALACDLRFMASSARIGMPIARLGILASPAFAARMTRSAGPVVAGELLYTGRLLDAADAVRTGLANRCFPDSEDHRGDPRVARTRHPRGEALDPDRGARWLSPKWTASGLLARVQQGCARLRPLMSRGRGRTPRRCVAAASTKLPLA